MEEQQVREDVSGPVKEIPADGSGAAPSGGVRARRAVELAALFGVLPLAASAWPGEVPVLVLLWGLTAGCLGVLWGDATFERARLWRGRGLRAALPGIFSRGVVVCAALTYLALLLVPHELFGFVRARPGFWAVVMCLYPLLSAYPQSIVYRAFVFHRYRCLAGEGAGMVLLSAAAFALAHIVLRNEVAVLCTFVGGLIFARTYQRTGSLVASWVEHALLGMYVFTIGLGRYFYAGSEVAARW